MTVQHERSAETEQLIERAAFRLLVSGAERWAQTELTMPQLKVLLLLAESEGAPVSWLAARMSVSPPNITGILDRLEQRSWVRRTNHPRDRRVVRIELTDEGRTMLYQLCGAGVGQCHGSIASLQQPEIDALQQGLPALLSALDERHGVPATSAPS